MSELTRVDVIKLIAVANKSLNLSGVDLSNIDLTRANLSGTDLSYANYDKKNNDFNSYIIYSSKL
jgi:uncharacterized protein YjbI with pentapeptide repeats